MRSLIAMAVLLGGSACASLGAAAQDRLLPCGGDPACPGEYPLRIAPAAVPGVPMVWSAARGHLVPPPVGREPIELGRTIPLAEIVGRRIHPLVRPPSPVVYNMPPADLDPSDPSLVLMRLVPLPRPVTLRRAD